MIVLDTTVLAFARGAEHPLKDPSVALLERVAMGELTATTTVEVVQEFAHVHARRGRGPAAAAAQARLLHRILTPLVTPTEDDLDVGLAIYAMGQVGCFDAVLAATARRLEATLVSADRGFATIDGLSYVDPASPTFLADLGIGFSDEPPAG